jgi:glycosyltransferase involved in cell wall biosynthesis
VHIFYFITKSEQGGAQTHVAQLARYFFKQGHQIAIMSAPGGWLEEETKRSGATFYPNPSLGNTANPFRLWNASRALLKAVNDFQPDLVACHSTISGLIGRFTLCNRIPTVFTAHGWSFTQGAKTYRRILSPCLERIAAHFCKKIICVSENDKQLALDYKVAPNEKIIMIHNGVEALAKIASPSQGEASAVADALVGRRNDERVHLLFIGRLAAPKNPFLLIQAFSQLPIKIRDRVHLTLIGDGPQKAVLKQIINQMNLNNQIALKGALPRQEVMETLKTADVFVLPTRYEGLPYAILEAMAHGVPVIASDVGGVKEAVGDDVGIVVPPNDSNALKKALECLIADPELRQQMGEAGRRKTQTIFSLNTMCEKIFDVYSAIIDETRAKARGYQ